METAEFQVELSSEDCEVASVSEQFAEMRRFLNDLTPSHTDPDHYILGRKFQTWDVIVDWDLDFLTGNVVKYISRLGRKGGDNTRLSDLIKCRNYIERAIELETAREEST